MPYIEPLLKWQKNVPLSVYHWWQNCWVCRIKKNWMWNKAQSLCFILLFVTPVSIANRKFILIPLSRCLPSCTTFPFFFFFFFFFFSMCLFFLLISISPSFSTLLMSSSHFLPPPPSSYSHYPLPLLPVFFILILSFFSFLLNLAFQSSSFL